MAKLEDRVFFVTGATSGIGEFTAELLAKELGGWGFNLGPVGASFIIKYSIIYRKTLF